MQNGLTIGYTRTLDSPLRSKFSACAVTQRVNTAISRLRNILAFILQRQGESFAKQEGAKDSSLA